jgi:hypothetical protein
VMGKLGSVREQDEALTATALRGRAVVSGRGRVSSHEWALEHAAVPGEAAPVLTARGCAWAGSAGAVSAWRGERTCVYGASVVRANRSPFMEGCAYAGDCGQDVRGRGSSDERPGLFVVRVDLGLNRGDEFLDVM